MANQIDPRRANIAMRAAVSRWKKFPDDSIQSDLDQPGEWVTEASLMNKFLPPPMAKLGFGWMVVMPNEFSVGIKLVRGYAGLIYKHMVPQPAVTAFGTVQAAALGEQDSFTKSAEQFKELTSDDLTSMAAAFFTVTSEISFEEEE